MYTTNVNNIYLVMPLIEAFLGGGVMVPKFRDLGTSNEGKGGLYYFTL